MPLSDENDKELEPFYSVAVAAELCGCTLSAMKNFLVRNKDKFTAHYHHDGSDNNSRRVLFRSEVIEIRRRMLTPGLVNCQDNENRSVTSKRKHNKRWERPSAQFLLNDNG